MTRSEDCTNNVTPEKDVLLCSPVRGLPEEPVQLSQVLLENVETDNDNCDDEEQDLED